MPNIIQWSSFPNLSDYDKFDVVESMGTPDSLTISLSTAPNITWWKSMKFVNVRTGATLSEVTLENRNHGPVLMTIPQAQYRDAKLVISKAKIFGAHTEMYEVFDLQMRNGRAMTFNWLSDAPNNFWDVIGSFISDIVNPIADAVVTVVRAVVEVVMTIVGFVTNSILLAVGMLLAIPVLGRALSILLNYIVWVLSTSVNVATDLTCWILSWIGIKQPEKLLRIVIIVQQDEKGQPVATLPNIQRQLEVMAQTFKQYANIRIIPMKPFSFSSPFSSAGTPNAIDFVRFDNTPSSSATLDVRCNVAAFGDNLLLTGTYFQLAMNKHFYGLTRSFLGFGAPLYVFAVRSFLDNYAGCCLWTSTKYATIVFNLPPIDTLAHEGGHACNLNHTDNPLNNLMFVDEDPAPPDRVRAYPPNLENGQIALMRLSQHCSIF